MNKENCALKLDDKISPTMYLLALYIQIKSVPTIVTDKGIVTII